MRTSRDIHNKPHEQPQQIISDRITFIHEHRTEVGAEDFLEEVSRNNNYQVRNQDGSDIDRETINFLAADQTIQAMFKPYLLEGTVNGKKMIFSQRQWSNPEFLEVGLG